ncbi:hypothetical protein MUP07_01805, partial [Candidatus Bathyarchaeota archaeon]|nr:hypothetical protein [Candidatus Bathyarchaeota archaeon]
SPVYAGPHDRRQTYPESAAKNSSTASGHARDLMGPSADISRSLGVLVRWDFVGSKREMSANRPQETAHTSIASAETHPSGLAVLMSSLGMGLGKTQS